MRLSWLLCVLQFALPALAAEETATVRFRAAAGPELLLRSVTEHMSAYASTLDGWFATDEAPDFLVAVRVSAGKTLCIKAALHDGEGGEARRIRSWCGAASSVSDGSRWVAHAVLTGNEEIGFARVALRAPGLKAYVTGHIDGQDLVKNVYLALPPGKHVVRVAGPGFRTRLLPVEVTREETVTIGR